MKHPTPRPGARFSIQSIRTHLTQEGGAIDLASIMVGVAVMAILAGVIAATVVLVTPWAQDNAAKSELDNIQLAQSVDFGYRATSGEVGTEVGNSFATGPELEARKLFAASSVSTLCISVAADGSDYLALIKSGSILPVLAKRPSVPEGESVVQLVRSEVPPEFL